MNYVLTPQAAADLQRIDDGLMLDNPDAADRVSHSLERAFELLPNSLVSVIRGAILPVGPTCFGRSTPIWSSMTQPRHHSP